MADQASLLRAIRAELVGGPRVLSRGNISDIYEAYLFTRIVAAARAEGADVAFVDRTGNVQSSLLFRTGPGQIYSRRQNYTHALVEFDGVAPLEIHVGVMVAGNSRVSQECDVAVLKSDEADRCRRAAAVPRCSQLAMAIEAKYYTAGLGLGLARGFLGLNQDFGRQVSRFVSNISSPSVERLLASKAPHGWSLDVEPRSTAVMVLMGQLRTIFKNYKARR